MKDNWKEKPSWARYRARDLSGEVYWYENKPIPVGLPGNPLYEENVWRSPGRMTFAGLEIMGTVPWNETLEELP